MTNFSRKFTSLLESMKSSNFIMEDDAAETKKERSGLFGDRTSTGKSQSRSDRKEKRLEDRFDKEGDDKFLVKAYIKAVELLKDQVLATRIDIFNTIKNKLAGAKYGDPILRSADTLLALMINLKLNAEKLAKEEGSRLEPIKNAEDIKTYKSLYAENEKEYEELKKKWNEAKLKEQNEQPVLAANQKIEKSLNTAKKYFTEAQTEFGANFAQFVQKKGEEKKDDEKKNDSSTTTELTATIKQAKSEYTGSNGDIVKEVKKLIYDKYKDVSDLTKTSFWKEVYKNYPNMTGMFGPNTASLIKVVKGTIPKTKADKTGDINNLFYTSLKDVKLKESLNINPGKIVSFNDFMRHKVNEDNGSGDVIDLSNISTLVKNVESGSSSSTKAKSKASGSTNAKSDVPSEPATPFKTKEDGNKFREWVNKKYPDWAKENNLDASGSENNTYIRKAYAQYGQEYFKATSTPEVKKMDGKQMNNLLAKIKEYSKKVELQLTTGSGEPVILFYTGKVYGHIYNNYRVSYVNTEGGKKVWWGTYKSDKEFVSFEGGKDFNLKSVVLCSITEKLSMTPEESEKMTKADSLLIKMSEMIIAKFGDTGFWKPFKGRINDDEDAAVAAFSKWYGKTIEDAYYNPAINRAKQLTNSKGKTNLLKNTTESNRFQFDKLINKLYGSTFNDTYKWTIYKSDGTSKSYKVDTDF